MQYYTMPENPTLSDYEYVDNNYLEHSYNYGKYLKNLSYEIMGITSGDIALDYGCGSGNDLLNMANIVGRDGKVFGLDVDSDMLLEAKKSVKDYSNVELQEIEPEADLPFKDHFFSAIRSKRVFQNTTHPKEKLQELTRVTKPGGKVVILDIDHSARSIDISDTDLENKLLNTHMENITNPTIGRQLYRLLVEVRLQDVGVNIFPNYFTDYIQARDLMQLDKLINQATQKGIITQKERDNLEKELDEKAGNGTFFAIGFIFMVYGTKPQ